MENIQFKRKMVIEKNVRASFCYRTLRIQLVASFQMFYMFKRVSSIAEIKIIQIQKLQKT